LAAQPLSAGALAPLHFFKNDALAAPASGLPFFPTAFDSQLVESAAAAGAGVCAIATDVINKLARRKAVVRNMGISG
jgi:hypothetical protein